jgi:hypothetical protein
MKVSDSRTSDKSTARAFETLKARFIDTRVSGSDETGVTVVDPSGKGTFFPDSGTPTLEFDETNFSANNEFLNEAESLAPLEALYPHWSENETDIGLAVHLLSKALADLQALAETSCASPAEVLNYLVLAEANLFAAADRSKSNKPLEIGVRFCAWAVRNQEATSGELPSIQGICSAIREFQEHPFLAISRVIDITGDLEKLGWSGDSDVSAAFDLGLSIEGEPIGLFD